MVRSEEGPDSDSRPTLDGLWDEAIALFDEVDSALDEHAEFSQMLATRKKVEDLFRRYHDVVSTLPTEERERAERTLGRKLGDVQKLAKELPAPLAGNPAEKRVDSGFFETRAGLSSRKPITIGAQPDTRRRGEDAPRYKVSGEVEAYCGPETAMRTHVIIAMVDGLPAQVVCQACKAHHKYRAAPPRAVKSAPTQAVAPTYRPVDREAEKRAKDRNTLVEQLRAAENVRAYSPKERYKAGEILEHPEHGRGKIENTLPRTLLVRFASGLKTLRLT